MTVANKTKNVNIYSPVLREPLTIIILLTKPLKKGTPNIPRDPTENPTAIKGILLAIPPKSEIFLLPAYLIIKPAVKKRSVFKIAWLKSWNKPPLIAYLVPTLMIVRTRLICAILE